MQIYTRSADDTGAINLMISKRADVRSVRKVCPWGKRNRAREAVCCINNVRHAIWFRGEAERA